MRLHYSSYFLFVYDITYASSTSGDLQNPPCQSLHLAFLIFATASLSKEAEGQGEEHMWCNAIKPHSFWTSQIIHTSRSVLPSAPNTFVFKGCCRMITEALRCVNICCDLPAISRSLDRLHPPSLPRNLPRRGCLQRNRQRWDQRAQRCRHLPRLLPARSSPRWWTPMRKCKARGA